jgi:hypothetical protein
LSIGQYLFVALRSSSRHPVIYLHSSYLDLLSRIIFMRLGMRLFPLSSPVVLLFDFIHVIFTFAFIVCLLLRSLVFQFFSVCFHFFLLPFSHHCFFTFCFLEFLHSFHFFQIILQISSRSLQIKKTQMYNSIYLCCWLYHYSSYSPHP